MSPLDEVAGCPRMAQCGHEACPWFVTCHMAFPISARSAGAVPERAREREKEGESERARGGEE